MSTTTAPTHSAEALGERLFGALLGASSWPASTSGTASACTPPSTTGGAQTSAGARRRAGIDERYAREWLEQQAVGGDRRVNDAARPAGDRRFALPEGHRDALLAPDSLVYATSMARVLAGVLAPIDRLVEAFRTGEGVPVPGVRPGVPRGDRGVRTARCSSTTWRRTGSRRSPSSTRCCGHPASGWRTWAAARAGRASAWRPGTRSCR